MTGYVNPVLLLVFVVVTCGTPSARGVATYLFEIADDPFRSMCSFKDSLVDPKQAVTPRNQLCFSNNSEVKLPGGTVRGEWRSSEGTAGSFCFASFMRIPYAEAPIGDKRFKAPVTPPTPWGNHTVLKKNPVVCPHLTFPVGKLVGEEDCLYLNVYTTHPTARGADSMPVMVYIHGGGFTFGSGDIKENGPDFIVSNDVVLVTFNYRLGALGFLSMDTDALPGNNGLKDQQAVILWVKENIHLFGGDPNKITIFGNSAGAASCHFHTLNKESSRMLSGAILQSGSAIASWAYTEDHKRRARLLAENFGAAKDASPEEIVSVLRSVSAQELVVGAFNITRTDPLLRVSSLPPFVPSPERRKVDGKFSEPIFMDRDPEYQMLKLAVDPVPMIMGVNKDEGLYAFYYTGIAANPESIKIINLHLEGLLPANLIPNADTARSYSASKHIDPSKMAIAAQAVRQAYNGGGGFDVKNTTSIIRYLGDIFTANDVHRVASLYQHHNKRAPLYLYLFDIEGDYNLGKKMLSMTLPGVTHTDELGYLFKISEPDLKQDPLAENISGESLRFLTTSWTDFAKTQAQSGYWVPATDSLTAAKPFLHISDRLEMVNLTLPEPWAQLYSLFRTPVKSEDKVDKPL